MIIEVRLDYQKWHSTESLTFQIDTYICLANRCLPIMLSINIQYKFINFLLKRRVIRRGAGGPAMKIYLLLYSFSRYFYSNEDRLVSFKLNDSLGQACPPSVCQNEDEQQQINGRNLLRTSLYIWYKINDDNTMLMSIVMSFQSVIKSINFLLIRWCSILLFASTIDRINMARDFG